MPKLGANTEMQTTQLGGNFSFSGVRLEKLGATEYTLCSVVVDVTGSTQGFADDLLRALKTSLLSLQKSPRAGNLLVRVVIFSTDVGVKELHGFKPLTDIDVNSYAPFKPDGLTNLFDATYEAVAATAAYGQQLKDNDFLANAILFIITDGGDNASRMTPDAIKQQVASIRTDEKLESILVLLIGINDGGCKVYLDRFERDADLDGYRSVDNATPQNLAKLAQFVSQSVSSQSQSLGTGGPSKAISATI